MKNLIKKWFKLFEMSDIENLMANIGNVSDRDSFEWRLKLAMRKQLTGDKAEGDE